MNTKEERIAKLEACIKILEKELHELKNEVAAIKGSEDIVYDAKDSIFGMSIEDMNLSVRTYNCLKRAGFNTLGELVTLSEENFTRVRNLGRKSYEEAAAKVKELISNPAEAVAKIQAEIKKREEALALNLEMSKKLLPAFEVYVKIRAKAKEEGIVFCHMGSGVFAGLHRRTRHYSGYVYRELSNGNGILSTAFCNECVDGKHPEMYKLLTFTEEKLDAQLIKAAILEDFLESNVFYNHGTKTYANSLKFIELIQKFEE